jgi:hypothetical protein
VNEHKRQHCFWDLGININKHANIESSVSVPDVSYSGDSIVKMIAGRFIASYDLISFSQDAPSSKKAHRISVSHLTETMTMTNLGRVQYPLCDTATLP